MDFRNAFLEVGSVKFSHQDIHSVVDQFYAAVQNDPDLKIPFQSVHDWPHHIERLTHFWWVRFGGTPYLETSYNPVLKHFEAGFNKFLLSKWLGLFQETLDRVLTNEQAKLWGEIAQRMGQSLSIRNDYLIEMHKV